MSKDLLTDAITIIRNAENARKTSCKVHKTKLIERVLKVMKEEGYIKDYKILDEERKIEVQLAGKINYCKTIKPRLPVKLSEFQKYEERFLPAADFGILILTTSRGVMTHKDAIKNKIGGRLLAFVY
ncbi:MAG: 30S ribosomal protein S8 [Candidatus Aenigmatarchaeota archaeon]|nr:30S ribosomal protein S8 [Candidatus Aenigmarchaeota archaeon]